MPGNGRVAERRQQIVQVHFDQGAPANSPGVSRFGFAVHAVTGNDQDSGRRCFRSCNVRLYAWRNSASPAQNTSRPPSRTLRSFRRATRPIRAQGSPRKISARRSAWAGAAVTINRLLDSETVFHPATGGWQRAIDPDRFPGRDRRPGRPRPGPRPGRREQGYGKSATGRPGWSWIRRVGAPGPVGFRSGRRPPIWAGCFAAPPAAGKRRSAQVPGRSCRPYTPGLPAA